MYCMSLLFNIIYITFSSIVRNVHFSIFPFVNHLHRKTFDSLNFGKIVFIDSYENIYHHSFCRFGSINTCNTCN